MKILGRSGDNIYADYIVQVSHNEMRVLMGDNEFRDHRIQDLRSASGEIPLNDLWRHLHDLQHQVRNLESLPPSLRAIADSLQRTFDPLAHPKKAGE